MKMLQKQSLETYDVLASVCVGKKRAVLCSAEKNKDGAKYLCGYLEHAHIFDLCVECVASDDYVEIAGIFGSRVVDTVKMFKEERKALDIPIMMITESECNPIGDADDINGKVVAITPKRLSPEYRTADKQICLVNGGLGAVGTPRGDSNAHAVRCTNVYTGEDVGYSRRFIMGEVKAECLPQWAREKLRTMGKSCKENNKDRER